MADRAGDGHGPERRVAWAPCGAPAVERWRYERILPWAARSRVAGRLYARIVASVTSRREAERRRSAVARIGRWYGVGERHAAAIHRASLLSEAQEEADSARFMRDGDALARWLPDESPPALAGPLVFASLHLGSPVLGFVYLRARGARDVLAMVRGLDESNPMRDGKRRFGQRKVAWVRAVAREGIVGTEPAAVARAREHLLAGEALFAAVDVPGDVVSRSAVVELHGERLLFAAGVVRLAALTRSTVVPMVALGGGRRMRVLFGTPVLPHAEADPHGAVFRELARFIDRHPGEWWMWPFLRAAPATETGRRSAGGD